MRLQGNGHDRLLAARDVVTFGLTHCDLCEYRWSKKGRRSYPYRCTGKCRELKSEPFPFRSHRTMEEVFVETETENR